MAVIMTRNMVWISAGLMAALGLGLVLRPDGANATPSVPAAPAPVEPSAAPIADAGVAQPQQDPTTATIVVATSPAANAWVSWGKKRIGRIKPGKPFVFKRPRDSGPLDLMVRAEGYLAVQTRAHTYADNRVTVKLTPVDKISEVLGYRAPLDAGVDVADQAALNAVTGADGGVAQGALPTVLTPLAPLPQ
jgi:hypothetical protein